ncbi:MAG: GTP-binding protein [Clostridia bacterium]|nr:GTP-binding protein [Clostridia bacterium]
MNKIIPVTLLTGYLGSGKTTLVNYVLNNQKGYKVAVIVNDIGEVNIDASLIQKGGVVNQTDDSLVPLQNGCICCTLKVDLMKQIVELAKTGKFDYILIEASGICEPIPIAQTITAISSEAASYGLPEICRLDNVVSVVDALRLATEFGCGSYLQNDNVDEEDIENLIIQQIEFCNLIVLNKVDEIKPEELAAVKAVIKKLQPKAEIIETNYGKVDIAKILDTKSFDLEAVASSAGWIQELENDANQEEHDEEEHEHEHHHEDEEEHEHHHHDHDDDEEDEDHDHEEHHNSHHHHHHHEGGEVEEYGIGTFVYYRRAPFNRLKFEDFAQDFPNDTVIRCKGILWFSNEPETGYIFEQAGKQIQAYESGQWIASAPRHERKQLLKENPDVAKDWDETYGDRMIKLVFIGKNMNKNEIIEKLDGCLDK